MLTVAALTSGHDTPSSRFRVRQHIATLAESNVVVHEFFPRIHKNATLQLRSKFGRIRYSPHLYPAFAGLQAAKIMSLLPGVIETWRHDAVWLSRCLYEGAPTFEPLLKGPVVLDVDDAIWLTPPFGKIQMRIAARKASLIIVGNQYLQEWFEPFNKNIELIPTAVDTDTYCPPRNKSDGGFSVGWIGTSGNYKYIYSLRSVFEAFFQLAPNAELVVIGERDPDKQMLPSRNTRFVRWSQEREIELIQSMDVGLMPLWNDDWARGKCSFKMLQYMACGKPVIASPVGMNRDVLSRGFVGFGPRSLNEWLDALVDLYRNPSKRIEAGTLGRHLVERDFSARAIGLTLARLFLRLA